MGISDVVSTDVVTVSVVMIGQEREGSSGSRSVVLILVSEA